MSTTTKSYIHIFAGNWAVVWWPPFGAARVLSVVSCESAAVRCARAPRGLGLPRTWPDRRVCSGVPYSCLDSAAHRGCCLALSTGSNERTVRTNRQRRHRPAGRRRRGACFPSFFGSPCTTPQTVPHTTSHMPTGCDVVRAQAGATMAHASSSDGAPHARSDAVVPASQATTAVPCTCPHMAPQCPWRSCGTCSCCLTRPHAVTTETPGPSAHDAPSARPDGGGVRPASPKPTTAAPEHALTWDRTCCWLTTLALPTRARAGTGGSEARACVRQALQVPAPG